MAKSRYLYVKEVVNDLFLSEVQKALRTVDFLNSKDDVIRVPFTMEIPISQMAYKYCLDNDMQVRNFNDKAFMVALLKIYKCQKDLKVKKVIKEYKDNGRVYYVENTVVEGFINFENPMSIYNRKSAELDFNGEDEEEDEKSLFTQSIARVYRKKDERTAEVEENDRDEETNMRVHIERRGRPRKYPEKSQKELEEERMTKKVSMFFKQFVEEEQK